jgi:hypothetical protein
MGASVPRAATRTGHWDRRAAGAVVLAVRRVFFLLTTVLVGWAVYHLAVEDVTDDWRRPWTFLVIWVLLAYILLPHLHRLLSRIYVPDYFIGRARTADGLLADPVNLAVVGTPEALRGALVAAGWSEAKPVTVGSGVGIAVASLLGRSDLAAPVSPLYVFGERQAMAFEREVHGSPAQRHHVRFWVCPPGWKLPGGYAVDLVGAATFDRRVGLSLFTFQITHKIAEDTDTERDVVVAALRDCGAGVHVVRDFSTGYHSRNGGGDAIETDGDLPIVTLPRTAA